jgi:hypothetical protein
MPALLGGLFIGVLSALPIVGLGNCCCCLWVVGGGALAGYLYQQQHPAQPITPIQGARVGLLAGIVGAFVWLAVHSALAPIELRFIDTAVRNARDLPPEFEAWLDSIQGNRTGSTILEFVLRLFIGSVVSTLGGVAGASYFRNDVPPALGGPIPPPPLP